MQNHKDPACSRARLGLSRFIPPPMNIYQQQQANRKRTWLIVAIFIVFFAFLGLGFDYFYLGYDPWTTEPGMGMPLPLATIFSIVFSSGWAWWGMLYGDRAVLSSSQAMKIEPSMEGDKYRQLVNVVHEMSIASGLPMPKVYIIFDPDPNAFATGRDPQHASIAVTQGLLDKLNREELQGVIAHEMSHVRNLDIRLMTTIAALVGAVALLSDWAMRGMRSSGGRSRSSSKKGGGGNIILFVIWLALVILAPIIAQILAMAVSREREYLADASGAELTRNPGGLLAALKKIESDSSPTKSIQRGTAHLCIADPLGSKMGLREGFLADLLATHPPMYLRINKLAQMAYQSATPAER
ncbi:MAG: M48 family metallopeptidase [Acidobacteria bacterium]|nr:M48 family metallopeptidase [Acidobacteriota bacterium]